MGRRTQCLDAGNGARGAGCSKRADADHGVRVIILTGGRSRILAGADMQNLDAVAGDAEIARKVEERLAVQEARRTDIRADFQKTYSYFPSISKPILGCLNGATVGLGFVIADIAMCDLRRIRQSSALRFRGAG